MAIEPDDRNELTALVESILKELIDRAYPAASRSSDIFVPRREQISVEILFSCDGIDEYALPPEYREFTTRLWNFVRTFPKALQVDKLINELIEKYGPLEVRTKISPHQITADETETYRLLTWARLVITDETTRQ